MMFFQAAKIFLIGIDVGVKKESENPTPLIGQYLERIDGAWRTADVE